MGTLTGSPSPGTFGTFGTFGTLLSSRHPRTPRSRAAGTPLAVVVAMAKSKAQHEEQHFATSRPFRPTQPANEKRSWTAGKPMMRMDSLDPMSCPIPLKS